MASKPAVCFAAGDSMCVLIAQVVVEQKNMKNAVSMTGQPTVPPQK